MIDFANLSEAVDMVNYFHHVPDHSSLKNIEAAHSSYQQLTIDTNRIQSTMNTIQQAKQIKEAAQTGGEGCVIKVMISNTRKECFFLTLLALIQMKDEIQAQTAINVNI